ncbi:MAG: PAS domain-containing protein [Rickettsiales bacterium]|nr:PAS domain-containing protein [Pseudomonadota bacterium]MDA0965986.1 PAS domain-containing protein [Pseudomonadota bacterium]MDG4542543.1 PAS domain-containing protein [Rickettsiales bacterium]MDG4545047.1 PAS domain-containing protein [Rickettsiales bacterium]MDG4547170.1 PAS domain-containing protein [Rickettsiales bacterium]
MALEVSEIMDRAISSTVEGITLSDVSSPDQPLVYVNGGFERMTGYGKDEILGKNCRFLQGNETDKNEVAKIRNAINLRQHCTIEFLNYKKNGEKFWNRLTVSPVSLPEDTKQYYVGVQCDITEIKVAQTKITEYAMKLEKKNEGIKNALQGFNDTIGRAMYDASSTSKKLAAKGISADQEVARMLEKIKEATESANDLILNLRSALVNLGGTEHLHNIDLVNFKAIRNFTDKK